MDPDPYPSTRPASAGVACILTAVFAAYAPVRVAIADDLAEGAMDSGGAAWVAIIVLALFAAIWAGRKLALARLLLPIVGPIAEVFGGWVDRLQRRVAEDQPVEGAPADAAPTLHDRPSTWALTLAEFAETSVREIMISRLDTVALPTTATWAEALATFREGGFSRLPLYNEHLDRILGVLYAKDLLLLEEAPAEDAAVDWASLTRPALFVPITRTLDEVLRAFQQQHRHLAIVVDEYGGTAGLVTFEDLIEEIVGDIQDEHDEDEDLLYERLDDRTLRVDARLNLDDVNELFDLEHTADAIDTAALDFETVGGLVYHLTGDVPDVGTEVQHASLHLRVETVENYRIGQVLVELGEGALPPA